MRTSNASRSFILKVSIVNQSKSFRPTDFSLRDVPGFLIAYVILSALFVVGGLVVPLLPPFVNGALFGFGIGLFATMKLVCAKPKEE